MQLWVDVSYEALIEDAETDADHAKFDDVMTECLASLNAQILATARREGLDVRLADE